MTMFARRSLLGRIALLLVSALSCSNVVVKARHPVDNVAFRPRQNLSSPSPSTTVLHRKDASGRMTATSPEHPLKPVSPEALSVRGGVVNNNNVNSVAGVVVMALIEQGIKKAFQEAGIKFPALLGGCIFLFMGLLLTEVVNAEAANAIFNALSPGAALLAKWLPVFFVPGLAMLPLSPSIGSNMEILKVLLVVVLGWMYSLLTTTFAVLALRTAQGTAISAGTTVATNKPSAATSSSSSKPFSDQTMSTVLKGSIVFAIISILATRAGNEFATPLSTVFFFLATVAAYVWGARLPAGFTKVVHPLVTCTAVVWLVVRLFGMATNMEFLDVLRTYRTGKLDPMDAGAGDILLYLLGPSVVSFAISMYSRRQLLFSNLLVVVLAMLVSSVGGLFGTAAFVRAIALGGSEGSMVRLSVLPRNVTTALAMILTSMLGGDMAIAASVVVLTGIIGATYGKTLLTAVGVTDPVSRGLGIGASSQGLGVASLADEPDAFPFAAISMVLTAIAATTLVSFPAVKDYLIQVATGATVIIVD